LEKNQKEINKIAKSLVILVEIFREHRPARDSEFWKVITPRTMFKPQYDYQDSQQLYDDVVQGILILNSEMLSKDEVNRRLIYEFLIHQFHWDTESDYLYEQELLNHAIKFVSGLVEFEKWQDLDIPIANLWPDNEPVTIGKVTFLAITKEEIEQWKKRGHCPVSIDEAKVVARVNSPGDEQKALSYARNEVNLVLDYIRAFCFPFGKYSDMWPVGLLGDFDASKQIPVRINKKNYVTIVGQGTYTNTLRGNILSKLSVDHRGLVEKLIQKKPYSDMERKLVNSIHWLGESTKQDTDNSKYAKIAFALESLLGGESEEKYLHSRGITAMLAERAAFIAGKDLNERTTIDNDIRRCYGKRSDIVHGKSGEVIFKDIDEFGELVRRLALAMLEKLNTIGDQISNIDALEKWVKTQRYSINEEATHAHS
jgi:hypothetical protein